MFLLLLKSAPVVQMDRIDPSEGKGQPFESARERHFLIIDKKKIIILLIIKNDIYLSSCLQQPYRKIRGL